MIELKSDTSDWKNILQNQREFKKITKVTFENDWLHFLMYF